MVNLGRMAILLILLLSVVYFSLYAYLRAGARERLEEDWVMQGRPESREDWVEARLAPRTTRLKRVLALVVYVLPLSALVLVTALTTD